VKPTLEKGNTMSVQAIQALTQQFCDAFNRKDLKTAVDLLSDDLEVFDHVPYRFDNKQQFADFLAAGLEGLASGMISFRQPSYRMFGDNVAIVNAYDTFAGQMKDGKVLNIHGRTTLVFVKQRDEWKIVSAHFSPMPHA
jgi:uncharacterized protein (TIGR02246 family)